jgi:hypothetical protein
MRVGMEGHERQALETVQAQIEMKRAWDIQRRGTWSGHRTRNDVGSHVKQACDADLFLLLDRLGVSCRVMSSGYDYGVATLIPFPIRFG